MNLGLLSSLISRAKWADEWFNGEDKLKRVHKCVEENRKDDDRRIRIAILDTGIDSLQTEMADNIVLASPTSCTKEERNDIKARNEKRSIKKWKGFPSTLDPLRDRVGHGTHCASVILRTAPYSALYIARIFNNKRQISDYNEVVKVIPLIRTLCLYLGFPMGYR
jgi:subtilisin family serine protease